MLKKIELVKRKFVMELELGQEVLIPRELSQNNLSYSFRFFDPIFHIVQEMMDPKKKIFYNMKTQLNLKSIYDKDKMVALEKLIGISNAKKEMVHKPTVLNPEL